MTNEKVIEYLKDIKYITSNVIHDADERKNIQEALNKSIKALEIVNEFETAQIITGGRLNGRTYAYKCGLADGQRSAKAVLDSIKAEILDEAEYAYADFDRYKEDILHAEPDELPDDDFRYGMERALEIISKQIRRVKNDTERFID